MGGMVSGTTFAGYVVEDVLARGGMGIVYRAREVRPERVIALKVVAPELAEEEQFRARFLREAQLAAEIEHPHVVPVLRVGEDQGRLFIAMRLIRGLNLTAVINAEQRLAPLHIAQIVDQIADALDTAHERGLVHRDVKPANVLVEKHRRGDHAYLTDFGLTKLWASSSGVTATGAVVGTIDYMAPEQLEGRPLDARADVYSLGCILFEGLTGHVPFPRDHQAARIAAHLTTPPPSVRELVPEVSPQLDEVVRRALAKNPAERYDSAGDLGRAALAAAQTHQPGVSPPLGAPLPPPVSPPPASPPPFSPPPASPPGPVSPPPAFPPAPTLERATAQLEETGQLPPTERLARPGRRYPKRGLILSSTGILLLAVAGAIALLSSGGSKAVNSGVNAADVTTQGRVAKDWLAAYNNGNDAQAAKYWSYPGTFTTADDGRTYTYDTPAQLSSGFSQGQGCALSPIGPWKQETTGYVVRVRAVGARPHEPQCTAVDHNYDEHFTFKDNLIQTLVSRKAPS